jgi:hypothetical protein
MVTCLCPSSKRSVAIFLGYNKPISIEHSYYKSPKKYVDLFVWRGANTFKCKSECLKKIGYQAEEAEN